MGIKAKLSEFKLNFVKELSEVLSNASLELKSIYQFVKRQPLVCLIMLIAFMIALYSLVIFPRWQVSHYNITDQKALEDAENNFRTTLAQILGGVAVGISLYYAWKKIWISQEVQINERFTRAIDQLGNEKMEIRLGGIYALESISLGSEYFTGQSWRF